MNQADKGATPVIAGSSIVDLRMWFDESPWRIAAGWSALAALLATGVAPAGLGRQVQTLLLLFVLVDPLWGSIWGLMSAPETLPSLQRSMQRSRIWLPYLRSGSPAARLFGMDGPSILALIYRVALPAIALAVAISLILHPAALWLTTAVIVISTAGWLHQQVESIPVRLLYGLVSVFLPWMLVILVLGAEANLTAQLLLAALWTCHLWAAYLLQTEDTKHLGLALLAASQIGIGVLLIGLRLPLWLVFVVLFFLPTWLAVYQNQSLDRVRFWWLAAMLLTGLALGSIA
ncbi:MAG: hypothetical protein KJZ86_03815 [Caldilineaceae bacterium]|nr:hypothetical protein [Caldilineaceae bacterium]